MIFVVGRGDIVGFVAEHLLVRLIRRPVNTQFYASLGVARVSRSLKNLSSMS